MKIGELEILEFDERSSMASSWTEFVCIERITADEFELSIRGYQAIGEISDYWDEEAGEYLLPDKIDGLKVHGTEDEVVVGGNLVLQSDDEGILIFTDPNSGSVTEWLRSVGWESSEIHDAIYKIVS
ncbi:MAG: hypothetical protein GY751_24825 [Bacteroidetes bacterium]|nr:hypothetical protein [Bacteroidota bacterium]